MKRIFLRVVITAIFSCFGLQSCKDINDDYKIRTAEYMLREAKISSKDSMRYVLWGSLSSGQARKYSAQLLKELTRSNIKYVLDSNFILEQGIADLKNVIIDS